ncbi:MAG TPA: sugar phosphate nucleotidyltransferase [Terriglobales bacterium]|nr:sugar phosphate nucleotidyltransferase [Terriglobales bacterium]
MPEAPDTAILCGGQGTRLRGTIGALPKPMVELGGRPLLDHLVRWALGAGSERVILCVGHGGGAIRGHFSTPDWQGNVLLSEEATPLGTGGALRLALPLVRTPALAVLNGDSFLLGLDLPALVAFHRQHGGQGAVALVTPDERNDAGSVVLDDTGRVQAFAEKRAVGGRHYINAGVYVFEVGLIAAVPLGRAVSLERDLLPAWVERGLYGSVQPGELVDIGTPERLRAAQARFADEFL